MPLPHRARGALLWSLFALLLTGLASSLDVRTAGTLPVGPANQVAVRPDGQRVAVTSADRLALFTLQGQRRTLLSPTGRSLVDAVFSGNDVLALDVTGTLTRVTGPQVTRLGVRLCGTLTAHQAVHLATAGPTIAVSCPDALLVGQPGHWRRIPLPAAPAFPPSGAAAVRPGAREVAVLRGSAVLRFRLSDLKPLPTITRLPSEVVTSMDGLRLSGASALTYDRAGGRLAVGWGSSFPKAYDQSVTLYDLTTGRGRSLPTYADTATRLSFSQDGAFLLSNGSSTPRIWDLQQWKRLPPPQPTNTDIAVSGVAWSGRNIISASRLGALTLTPEGKLVTSFPMPSPSTSLAAFSGDGQRLALAAGDGRVFLYDLKTGRLRWTVKAHESGVASLQFNPAGTLLASGNANSERLRFWDVHTGRALGGTVIGTRAIAGFATDGTGVVMAGRVVPLAPLLRQQGEVNLDRLPGRIYRTSPGEGARLTQDEKSACETSRFFTDRGLGFRASSWQVGGLDRKNFGLTLPEERHLGVTSADCRVLAVVANEVLGKAHTLKPLAVEVYDPATGRKLRAWPIQGRVDSLALSADGRTVAYLEAGRAALVLGSVSTGKQTFWTLPPVAQDLTDLPLAFRADGRALLIGMGTRPGTSFTVLNVP